MTLQEFTKVNYNKKMKEIKQRLDELENNYKIVTLYNCYNDCSIEKCEHMTSAENFITL